MDHGTATGRAARAVLLVALVLLAVAAAAPAGAASARAREGARAVQDGPLGAAPLVEAQEELDRALQALAAWEVEQGTTDPEARVAELEAELERLEAQRLLSSDLEARAEVEFAIAGVSATRDAVVAAQPEHDRLVAEVEAARAAVVAAKLAVPAPRWAPTTLAPPGAVDEAPGVAREAPVRDDTWMVLAIAAGLGALLVLAVVALRHHRWRSQVFALEVPGPRAVALAERDDAPGELPRPRARARARGRAQGLP